MDESELETSHLANTMRDTHEDFEFAIGMVFQNELEAYHKYLAYAIGKGFGVRKSKMVRNAKGEITKRMFVCNCEGYSSSSSDKEKKYERSEVRCGCLAYIKFKVDDGIYEVIEYISEHNHALVPESQRHLIRCARSLSDTFKVNLINMAKAGIGGTSAYKYLSHEAGNNKNLGFTIRDCQNLLQTKRSSYISGGDCQSVMDHFEDMQMKNPMFFRAVQFDQDGRLTNIFWRDSLSKFDYDCFGDVVVFDTTYCTNKYNLTCAPFVGVNHHWKNILFGCAFLADKTADSFIWLFEAFLKSMGNKAPKIIFTDQDQAMEKALRIVLPNTQHYLCTWHIEKNVNKNIPHLYNKPGFIDKYFSVLMYRCRSEYEFESIWREMEEEWDTKNNKWLRRLYDLKHKWSSAFGRDIFSCGIRSSQRSENTNVFQLMSKKALKLIEFVYHYEEQLKHMREVESQDDYHSRGMPKLRVMNCGILTHAAFLYTRVIFKKFSDELFQSLAENITNTRVDGLVYEYTLECDGSQCTHVVRFDPTDFSVSCECKLFETNGWLCRHALKVYLGNTSIKSIPSSYILNRWTKGAKQGIVHDESYEMPTGSSKSSRFSKLMQESFEIMNLGAEDENTMSIIRNHLQRAKVEILAYKSNMIEMGDANDDEDADESADEVSLHEISVFDPPRRKGKGICYGRLKSSTEKKKKNPKKRSLLMQVESQELVVQATHDDTHSPVNLNIPHQMQPPYITSSTMVNEFPPFPNQIQSPYTMPGIMKGYSLFTSQGSSNTFENNGMNELNKGDSGHS